MTTWSNEFVLDEVPGSNSELNKETKFSETVLVWVFRIVHRSDFRCYGTYSTGNSLVSEVSRDRALVWFSGTLEKNI